MKKIEVVYSPLCEATGAMIGKLRRWLDGTGVQVDIFPFDRCPPDLKSRFARGENCFIDAFYRGSRIDTVPLHREKIYEALGIQRRQSDEQTEDDILVPLPVTTGDQLAHALKSGDITFHPIRRDNYMDEMSMCLCNYPFGNPPEQFHQACREIKSQVFSKVWDIEDVAGIYAKYRDHVIGLLEVMPREIVRKYGYMTGTTGDDSTYLTVGCYEVGCGVPRVDMLDLLMQRLETVFPLFRRKHLEGVGIYGWLDGFNPYWVYKKYGFKETERLSEHVAVMSKAISGEKG